MASDNPYEAPDAPLEDTGHGEHRTATSGWRLVNMLVDTAGFYALAFLVGALLAAFNLAHILEQTNEYVFGITLWLAYYTPQEALLGRTLGKLVSGTRVVDANGDDIGWGQALKRSLLRLIPFEAFSFLGNSRPRGWHDKLSNTRVVSLREKKPAAHALPDNTSV